MLIDRIHGRIASRSKAPTAATSPAAELGALDQHLEAAAVSYVLDTCDRRRVNRTGFVGETPTGRVSHHGRRCRQGLFQAIWSGRWPRESHASGHRTIR